MKKDGRYGTHLTQISQIVMRLFLLVFLEMEGISTNYYWQTRNEI